MGLKQILPRPLPALGFPPSCYLIGTQKAGTTFLANLLAQHPCIELSRPKEAAFYTQNWERGTEWYRERFDKIDGQVLLDATPSYSAAPLSKPGSGSRFEGVPERIHSLIPDARFIYVLRDPVERTYSAYWHFVRTGDETRSFREAIEAEPRYLDVSDYSGQLDQYMQYFHREDFLVLLFEELTKDPIGVAGDCFRFLGVSEMNVRVGSRGRNRTYVRSDIARFLDALLQPVGGIKRAARLLAPWTPYRVQEALLSLLSRRIPPMSQQDRAYLIDYFAPRNRALSSRLGIDLSTVWQC